MKKTKFTEEQFLFALEQGASGQPIADVCLHMEHCQRRRHHLRQVAVTGEFNVRR